MKKGVTGLEIMVVRFRLKRRLVTFTYSTSQSNTYKNKHIVTVNSHVNDYVTASCQTLLLSLPATDRLAHPYPISHQQKS